MAGKEIPSKLTNPESGEESLLQGHSQGGGSLPKEDKEDILPEAVSNTNWRTRFPLPESLHDPKFHTWVRSLDKASQEQLIDELVDREMKLLRNPYRESKDESFLNNIQTYFSPRTPQIKNSPPLDK